MSRCSSFFAAAAAPLCVIACIACGPPQPSDGIVSATNARDREAQLTRAFDKGEDEILRDLATIDRRIALRAQMTPSEADLRRVAMTALLTEDPTVIVIEGAIDPFSFDARARGLDAARAKIASSLPSDVSIRTSERELLVRLMDAETLRLDEERALPRSASALIRAIVDTWQPPKGQREVADADRWLSRRLRAVREAMTSSSTDAATSPAALDVIRARELDDGLDALEKITSIPGFTHTTQELVLVRDALEAVASRPAAKAHSDWATIARRIRAHLGVSASAEDLSRDLAKLENDVRARADQAILAAHVSRDTLILEKNVFTTGPCTDAIAGSPVRSMAAPHEREAACHLRHFVAKSEDDASYATALATMLDHVVIAEWALDVARGASTIAETQGRHRLFVPVQPDVRARYERIALARPVTAIGAGEAVNVIMMNAGNADNPKKRATTWSSSLGDVPLDIAKRELAVPPR